MNIIRNPNSEQLNNLRKDLKKGNLIVYPTDTIYGVAACIHNITAIKQVYKTKKRSYNKPISICVHDFNQLYEYVQVTNPIFKIIKLLLPGPYTLILNKTDKISPILTSNTTKIAVRMSNNKITKELTKDFPITSTSANLSNINTPDNIQEIIKQLKSNISTYIDCGIIKNNQPSTIIDLTNEYPKIIRKGQFDEKILNSILKINLY